MIPLNIRVIWEHSQKGNLGVGGSLVKSTGCSIRGPIFGFDS